MGCPCCHSATEAGARSCPACGAPLLLADEPAPIPLDRTLDLDRRQPRDEPAPIPLGRALDLDGGQPQRVGSPDAPRDGAPRWCRAAAWGIDAAVLAAACTPPICLAWLALPAGADPLAALLRTSVAFVALLGFAYGALGHALMGATLGKRLLGLQVVGPDGGLPSLTRSAARSCIAVLGLGVLGAGVAMALFTPSRRGLHDLIADTVVIRTP